MKFKEYFTDVLELTKKKLASAETEELELLRKLEQIRKKQSLYKKNIKEIEDKLNAETVKINKELFKDTKKIDKELSTADIETPLKTAENPLNIDNIVEESNKEPTYDFGERDFLKAEKKATKLDKQSVVIDKDFENLLKNSEQSFETDRLVWSLDYIDSKTIRVVDVNLKVNKLKPNELIEELHYLFNYFLTNEVGRTIEMEVDLQQLFESIVDMNEVDGESKNQIIEQFRQIVNYFEKTEEPTNVDINNTIQHSDYIKEEADENEEDNEIDYWEIYE